jgi:hypothetical protein
MERMTLDGCALMWNDDGQDRSEVLGEVNLLQCHFLYHRYRIHYTGSIPYHPGKNLATKSVSNGKGRAGYMLIATLRTSRHFRIVNVKSREKSESSYIFIKNVDHKLTQLLDLSYFTLYSPASKSI